MHFRDSSGDEQLPPKKKKRKCRISKCCKKKDKTSDDSDSDDTKKLLPSEPPKEESDNEKQRNHTYDSDYYSSGHSTDYSYTYQTSKDITSPSSHLSQTSFRDVERQYRHEYASMDSFRDTEQENDVPRVNSLRDKGVEAWFQSSSTSTTTEPRNVQTKQPRTKPKKDLELFSFLRRKKTQSKTAAEEETSLLSSNEPLSSTDDESTSNAFDTDSSIDSEIQEQQSLVVPKLDLSALETETEPQVVYNKPGNEQRFKNIKYEVVKETSSSSSGRTTIRTASNSGSTDREIMDVPFYPEHQEANSKMLDKTMPEADSKYYVKSKTGGNAGKPTKRTFKTISKRKRGKRYNKFIKFFHKIFRRVRNQYIVRKTQSFVTKF